ncbi:MAG TPA: GNAT family N-acetyltransferase [Longimicrobiales bacterium]|nr:GNAT family N-acetyltransferase [Longimicrobiales bacterium]
MSLVVQVPATSADLDQVRALLRAFVDWHYDRHRDDARLIDRYFDGAAFEAELASLPGKYAPPDGQLLLATRDAEPAGCVALRGIDRYTCEMKRMFVYPDMQGGGVGRALAEAVLEEARRLGYSSMVLDTSIRQEEAQRLYRRLGFQQTEPYYELPEDVRGWLVFMRYEL